MPGAGGPALQKADNLFFDTGTGDEFHIDELKNARCGSCCNGEKESARARARESLLFADRLPCSLDECVWAFEGNVPEGGAPH